MKNQFNMRIIGDRIKSTGTINPLSYDLESSNKVQKICMKIKKRNRGQSVLKKKDVSLEVTGS